MELSKELLDWISGNDTGSSSKAIFRHMTTGKCDGSHPHDTSDLGRCLRLLDIAPPTWTERILEMAKYNGGWAGLAPIWQDLTTTMTRECGKPWNKGAAPQTYAMMEKAIEKGRAEKPDGVTRIKLGKGVEISFGSAK